MSFREGFRPEFLSILEKVPSLFDTYKEKTNIQATCSESDEQKSIQQRMFETHLLCDVIVFELIKHVECRDIVRFMSTCKSLIGHRCCIRISDKVEFHKIKNLPYFDSFTNVVYSPTKSCYPPLDRLPLHIEKLCIEHAGLISLKDVINIHKVRSLKLCSTNVPEFPPNIKILRIKNYTFIYPFPPDVEAIVIFNSSRIERIIRRQYFCDRLIIPPLPEGLQTLSIHGCNVNIIDRFPSTLKKLKLIEYSYPLPPLPEGLETLIISNNSVSMFPSSLKNITLYHFSGILPRLPEGLISLVIHGNFKGEIEYLPNTLKCLRLLCPFNKKLEFPKGLEILEIDGYNQVLDNLPENLKVLKLGHDFNHDLDNLPDSIEEIYLGNTFNRPIYRFPRNIKKIDFGKEFSQDIPEIPDGTETIVIHKNMKKIKKLPKTIKKIYYRTRLKLMKVNLVPAKFRDLMEITYG